MSRGSRRTARYTPTAPFTWSNACHVCTCEVDPVTGAVTLLRYVVSEDCGVMINPMVVEGQIAGGVVQGIGGVLYEHMVYDDDGNPLATTFLDYLLPTAAEVPDHRVRPHRDAGAPQPRRLQGHGGGRRHRRHRRRWSTPSPTRSLRSVPGSTANPWVRPTSSRPSSCRPRQIGG